MLGRARVPVALAFAIGIGAPADAIRFNWTPEETQCARSVGIELDKDPDPGSANYVKRLAWLADLVVYGKVDKTRHDPRGPYPTTVRINVLSIRKGRLPKGPLTVALTSEPGREPSFARGETVLLFLTKRTLGSDPGQSHELPEDSYGLVNDSKFRIDGVTATLQGSGSGEYNVIRSDYQIREVVAAQSTNCRGKKEVFAVLSSIPGAQNPGMERDRRLWTILRARFSPERSIGALN